MQPVAEGFITLLLLGFTFIVISNTAAFAQFRNINQAQTRIRERMIREQAGNNPGVDFKDEGSFSAADNNLI